MSFPFPIKWLQCDHGQEFSFAFALGVEAAGIRHRYIRPRRPQQNGKVERSHRIDNEEFWNRHRFQDFEVARCSSAGLGDPVQLRALLPGTQGPHTGRKTRRAPAAATGRLGVSCLRAVDTRNRGSLLTRPNSLAAHQSKGGQS